MANQERIHSVALPERDYQELVRVVIDEDKDGALQFMGELLARLKQAEKAHCDNLIDLQSQGKSIAGMQAEVLNERSPK